MNIKNILGGLGWCLAAWTAPAVSQASILAYEGFDYMPGNARLSDVSGGPTGGFGWAGGWTNHAQGTFLSNRMAGVSGGEGQSLNPGFPFETTGGYLRSEYGGESNHWIQTYRQFADAIDFGADGIYYVSVLLRGNSLAESDAFVYLATSTARGFWPDDSLIRFGLGSAASTGGSTGRFNMRVQGGATILGPSGIRWEANQTYLAVLKIVTSAESGDAVYLDFFSAVRPLPADEPTQWMFSTTLDSSVQADWIRLSARGDADNLYASHFDEIRIGISWEAVTPVPEPAAAPLTYGLWRFERAFASPREGDPWADPNGNGLPNAVAYALGLDPATTGRGQLPVPSLAALESERFLTLSLSRNEDAIDVALQVEVSSDLEEWRSGGEFMEMSEESDGSLTARDKTPVSGADARFMRVKVGFVEEWTFDLADWEPEERTTPAETPFYLYSDVTYLGDTVPEKLDIYLPADTSGGPRPAMVIIHGGGWATGSKTGWREREFAHFMVDQGYAAISISYRLTQYEGEPWSSPKVKGGWPDNIFHCKTALRFLKVNAETLGIDPERIGVMGGSAGGHLAMLTGLSPDHDELNSGGLYTFKDNRVRCIVNFYGIPDVRVWGGSHFLDVSRMEAPEVWAMASPIEHLHSGSPPMFVTHGTEDATVDVSQSDDLVAALQNLGVPHVYHRIDGAGHTYGLNPEQLDLRPLLAAFLKDHLE